MAKSLERQLDAHVTADATEQWITLALRRKSVFDPHAIALKVPDCGYKLRRIEFQAVGELAGDRFVIAGSGQVVNLSDAAVAAGQGELRGAFEAPVTESSQLVVESFVTGGAR